MDSEHCNHWWNWPLECRARPWIPSNFARHIFIGGHGKFGYVQQFFQLKCQLGYEHISLSLIYHYLDTLRPEQNGCHFTDDIFKYICLYENIWISIDISLKFVLKDPTDNKLTLVSSDALAPCRCQTITWTRDDLLQCACIYHQASMGWYNESWIKWPTFSR